MYNKRGLSAIITTLLVVVLVLVAVGIVWGVINNLLTEGAEGIESSARCLNINVKATSVNCDTASACVVTLTRTGSDDDEIGGVKLVFFEGTDTSGLIDSDDVADLGGNIEKLAGKTITDIDSTLSNPDKIEVTVYLGEEQLCSTVPSNIGDGTSIGENCDDGICDVGECNSCPQDCTHVECCGIEGCNVEETCGDDDVEPACNTDCDVCPASVCGDLEVTGDEECDSGGEFNCIDEDLADECTCEPGFIPDPESNGCIVNPAVVCNLVFDEGEQCDGGVGCILPDAPSECTCDTGYIPTVPPSAGCDLITYIDSGTIDNVWPPGIGLYFDAAELPKEEGLYYGKVAFFPIRDPANCYLIVGYSYNPSIYANAIVELDLFEPLTIATDDAYQIWDSMSDCTDALAI